ncbi:ATP-binding protein [Bacillus sp. Marseille-P3661]|uniref:ATP-binding protein n=1 Tax=Bacillus sp. Marseille-P3661 TaxID=1936234 RepID=UPI000C8294CB|nr:ATP-binding protein [Bacillus sp. Marseille-P3661]
MAKKTIISLYIIFSIIWILTTDFIIAQFVPGHLAEIIETTKEFIYVIITGSFLYFIFIKTKELNQVKETEKRLSTLINSMVDFVNFKDGEGRWIEANQFGLQLFQLENVQYRGKTDLELAEYTSFYHDALKNCHESDEIAWMNAKSTRFEEVVALPNDTQKTFDTIKIPLFHPDGTRKGLVIIGRDVTSLRLAEEKLRQSEKLSIVGELAASVAHEIRNPLTSLKGFVQLLPREDSNQQYYDIMHDELKRINDIVDELLLLAKPQKLHFKEADIQKILDDVLALLSIQARQSNIELHSDGENKIELIECEPNQLKQVLINLIKNAIEASKNGGKVTISLNKDDKDHVIIIIKDNGCGISKERLAKIGEPFYSSKEKGTGLGLTVSFNIVQAHNGTIKFTSVPDHGTEVSIRLPVHPIKI